MNKRQIEVEKAKLAAEERQLKQLKAIYGKASDDIANKIKVSNGKIDVLLKNFDNLDEKQKSILQSQIYQRDFQKSLQKQIDGFMKELESKQYKTVSEYLKGCYDTGYIGAMYDIAGQGIPLIMPIDQKKVTKAMVHDTKLSKKLYTKLGEDVDLLKKRIANNISRGIATADSYANIARNIANGTNVGINKTMRIARTEGHRIQSAAAFDAQHEAKNAGADVVKMWSAALDGRTRDTHRELDGQIREIDEPFEVGGMTAMYPSDFGDPAEDINCRCALLQRARWALDDDELQTLQERAAYYGLDKTDSFNEFRDKYLKAAEEVSAETDLSERRKQRLAERRSQKLAERTNTNAVNITPEMTTEEIDRAGRRMLFKHWEDYRQKFLGNPAYRVDLEGLDSDTNYNVLLGKYKDETVVETILKTVDNLSSKFYSPLQTLVWMDRLESGLSTAFAVSNHAWGHGIATIKFNPLKLGKKGVKRIAELSDKGYSIKVPIGREIEYITAHEYGHCILNIGEKLPSKANNVAMTDFKTVKKARKEIEAVWDKYAEEVVRLEKEYKEFGKELDSKFLFDGIPATPEERNKLSALRNRVEKTKISDYSLTKSDEFVAEAFADVVINGDNATDYSKEVYNILEKYFGKD